MISLPTELEYFFDWILQRYRACGAGDSVVRAPFQIFREDGPALMIPPAPVHFHITAGKTFPHKAATPCQPDGSPVLRLDVGFQTMEPEFLKGVFKDELHSLAHQSFPGMGGKSVIANVGPLQRPANDIAQVDDPDDFGGVPEQNQKSAVRIRSRVSHISLELLARVWRGNPRTMKLAAAPDRRLKCRPVSARRWPDDDARFQKCSVGAVMPIRWMSEVGILNNSDIILAGDHLWNCKKWLSPFISILDGEVIWHAMRLC